MTIATDLMQGYLAALSTQDIDAIQQMSGAHCLVEIPFLKPNRLVGTAEIVKAHREIFANLEEIHFSVDSSQSNARHAIAEGRLEVQRDAEKQSYAAGLVAEADGAVLGRISLYCDARNVRPWSDKAIL